MAKPITPVCPSFKLENVVYAENQPEYIPLPAYKSPDGMVVTRWRFSLMERLRIALTGDLWLTVLTFNKPLQPVKLETSCPIYGHTGYDEEI